MRSIQLAALAFTTWSVCTLANAVEPNGTPQLREVELFTAMQDDVIEVKFIPLGSHRANVFIENSGDAPLDVQLPAAFGAAQVLGQFAGGFPGGGFGPPAGGQGAGGGAAQGLGGGFGNQGNPAGGNLGQGNFGGGNFGAGNFGAGNFGGGANFGGGRGLFRIEPHKTRKLVVDTVCLEYGKKDPNPRMVYQLVPLDTVNDKDEIRRLCVRLGNREVGQTVAQAAAWHLTDELSWEKLASLNRIESRFTGNVRYFTNHQLQDAVSLVGACQNASAKSRKGLSLAER